MRRRYKLLKRYILLSISVMGYLLLVQLFRYDSCDDSYDSPSTATRLKTDFNEQIVADYREGLRGTLESTHWTNIVSSVFNSKMTRQGENYINGIKKDPSKYQFDCSNIHLIRLRQKVGEGVSKETYLGEYNGREVAVKMVTRHQADVKRCLWKYQENLSQGAKANISNKDKDDCYIFPTMKLMKETLILQQLNHPGIVKLLGFCVRSEESATSDLSKHGVTVIEEYGSRFMLSSLQVLPWQTRLQLAHDLSGLLFYIQHSPLGSLKVPDFKEDHFLMSNGTIKLTDFDDVSNVEPVCHHNEESRDDLSRDMRSRSVCDFNISCELGLCVGANAKRNLQNMKDLFFKRLILSGSFPDQISDDIAEINIKLNNLSIGADELYSRFSQLLELVSNDKVVK